MSDMIEVQVGEVDLGEATPMKYDETAIMTTEREDMLVSFIVDELDQTKAEAESRRTKIDTWRRHRLAQPKQATKNSPWVGASNTSPPMTAMLSNTAYALLKQIVTSVDPRMSCTMGVDRGGNAILDAEAIEWLFNFLNESTMHVNLPAIDEAIFMDSPLLGTQFVDIPWGDKRWATAKGGIVDSKVTYSGPLPKAYRLEDVRYRTGFADVQTVPALMMANRFSKSEMVQNKLTGFFRPEIADTVLNNPDGEFDTLLINERQRMGENPTTANLPEAGIYTVWKVYCAWDVQGDGTFVEVEAWVHFETKSLLRVGYNALGKRPVVAFRYLALPGEIAGVGIGHYCEPLQEEVETLHNMGIDSSHLSSLQMLVTRKGSGIKKGETLQPGKFWDVSDPMNDLRPITFPDVSGSTLPRETMTWQYGQQVTGMSDAIRGMPDMIAKSRTSGVSIANQIGQAGGIFGSVTDSIKQAYGELFMYEVLQCVVNGEYAVDLVNLAPEKYRESLVRIFSMDVKDIPYLFSFSLRSTPVDETKEAQKQNVMMRWQLSNQYGQQLMQYYMMLANPQVTQNPILMQPVIQLISGLNATYEEMLKSLNVERPEDYTVVNMQIEQMSEVMKNAGQVGGAGQGMGPQPGGNGGVPGPQGPEVAAQNVEQSAVGAPQQVAGGGAGGFAGGPGASPGGPGPMGIGA
jgi:hypothetical protein